MSINPVNIFVNVSKLFLPGVSLVFTLFGVVGLFAGLKAMFDTYRHLKGDNEPGMIPKSAIPVVLMLSGAAVVIPIVIWHGANVIVLGGDQTYNLFSYVQNTETSSTCNNISRALTMFCMLCGSVALFMAWNTAYRRTTQPGASGASYGGAAIRVMVGICLFFSADVLAHASKQTGLTFGLPAICEALDGSSS